LLFVDCTAKDKLDAVVMDKQDSNGLLLARLPVSTAGQVRAQLSAQDLSLRRELGQKPVHGRVLAPLAPV